MRTSYLLLLLAAFVGPAIAQAADAPTATVTAPAAAEATQTAAWTPRKLTNFSGPLVITSETGKWEAASCDRIYSQVKFVLLELGARADEMRVDQRGCYAATAQRTVDVTFLALAPADKTGTGAAGDLVPAQWKTVALKGDCAFLEYVTLKVLPSFSAKDVKVISRADCKKLGDIGLYAKILMPLQQAAPAP